MFSLFGCRPRRFSAFPSLIRPEPEQHDSSDVPAMGCDCCSCLLLINLWGSCSPTGTRAVLPLCVCSRWTDGRRRLGSGVSTEEAGFGPGGIKASCWDGAASVPLLSAAISEDLRNNGSRDRRRRDGRHQSVENQAP